MTRLQRALDDDWLTFQRSPAGLAALTRWTAEDHRYARLRRPRDLRSYFERRDDVGARSLMADLLRRGPNDPVARRVLLAALGPACAGLLGGRRPSGTPEEAESIVLAAAIDRFADREITMPTRVSRSPRIRLDHRVERAEAGAVGGGPTGADGPTRTPRHASGYRLAQVPAAALVDEAVRRGAVPRGALA